MTMSYEPGTASARLLTSTARPDRNGAGQISPMWETPTHNQACSCLAVYNAAGGVARPQALPSLTVDRLLQGSTRMERLRKASMGIRAARRSSPDLPAHAPSAEILRGMSIPPVRTIKYGCRLGAVRAREGSPWRCSEEPRTSLPLEGQWRHDRLKRGPAAGRRSG